MSGVSTVHATTGFPVAACAEASASAYSGRSRPMSIATAPETSGASRTSRTLGSKRPGSI
jgi:hypothetical protein